MPIVFPPISAGQQILNSQQGRSDDSLPQTGDPLSLILTPTGRIQNADRETNPTNAVIPLTGLEAELEFGTDPDLVTIAESQSTDNTVGLGRDPYDGPEVEPVDDQGGYYSNQDTQYPETSTNPGVGAGNDDAAPMNSTQSRVDQLFSSERIVPQRNILDQYASYTWTAEVYILKKDDATELFRNKKKALPQSQLLFRSGGAGARDGSNTVQSSSTSDQAWSTSTNSPFTLDYYIDELELKSKIAGRGTTAAHNVYEFKMTVVEPYGLSLLDNLYAAAQIAAGTPNVRTNYQSTQYLLVVKFWGYDDLGNLVTAGNVDPDGAGTPGVITEKYYPFVIENISLRVANKVVQYDWQCKCIPHSIGFGQARGSIPYNIELAGGTLKQLLGAPDNNDSNNDDGTEGSSGSGAATTDTAQNQNTITSGLMAAMNRYQAKLVKDGVYTIADEYSIEFTDNIIASARLRKIGTGLNKSATPMSNINDPGDTLASKQLMYPNLRLNSAFAGTQIVQFLDKVIRNSTYITDQAVYNYDEETQKIVPKPGNPAKSVAWFKIGVEAVPKNYDPKRNDYAYKIKFIVSPYRVDNLQSIYFAQPRLNGVHKQYNYWFTGENTQVLDFQQNFNALYYEVISGKIATQNITSTGREIPKRFFQPFSNESNQGADGKTNEVSANAADYLYSPTDQGDIKITVVGDPAWLQQGETFAGFRANQFNYNAFLPDGTINYDSQQILFEIIFNLPVDYNLNTGLQDPGQNNFNANRAGGLSGKPRQSYVYYAYEVTSHFKQGRFIQDIQGKIRKTLVPKVEEVQPTTSRPIPGEEQDYSYDYNVETSNGVETVDSAADQLAQEARNSAIESGVAVSATPYEQTVETNFEPNSSAAVSDQPGISATEASFNLTSQEPEYIIGPASFPLPPDSDGLVVGLPDGPPTVSASGATGVVDNDPQQITQNEILTPKVLNPQATLEYDLSQYEAEYAQAQLDSQAAERAWLQAVADSRPENFPGATGANPDPVARQNWITARQNAADLKVIYNNTKLAENTTYGKLVNVRQLATSESQQLIARETRGG